MTEMLHGVDVSNRRKGESRANARSRILRERHQRRQQDIASGKQPLYAKAPDKPIGPKVIGLDYTPTLSVRR